MENAVSNTGVLSGIVASYLMDYLVRANWFKWVSDDSGNKIKRTMSVALAALFTVGAAILKGDLQQGDVQALIENLFYFLQTIATSTAWHHWVMKVEKPPEA